MRASNFEHVPSHQRRADIRSITLPFAQYKVAIDVTAVVQSCHSVSSLKRQWAVRRLELPDQVFAGGLKYGGPRCGAADATVYEV